jgi:hypothetical protein
MPMSFFHKSRSNWYTLQCTKDREEEEIIQTHSSVVSFTVIYLQIFYFLTPHDVRKLIDHRTLPNLCLQTQASQI